MNQIPNFINKHLTVSSRSGYEWQCLCPFHSDTSPSFSVNVKKGLFICYACGAKGGMKELSERFGVKNTVNETYSSIEEVEEKLQAIANPVGKNKVKIDQSYWTSRYQIGDQWKEEWAKRLPLFITGQRPCNEKVHVTRSSAASRKNLELFALGYDHIKHELIIPIFDSSGSAETCVRRRLGKFDGPKYLYSKGFKTSLNLYGYWQTIIASGTARPKVVVIVEGAIDALSMWEIGYPAVALFGSNMSSAQKKLLLSLDAENYVIMTDRDTAGRKAEWQILNEMSRTSCLIATPMYWEAGKKDVAEMNPHHRMQSVVSALHRFESWLPHPNSANIISKNY